MPELPEVETILRAIEPVLRGNSFRAIEVLRPNMVRHNDAFTEALRGRRIVSLERRGKYLLLETDGNLTLILHLKMTNASAFICRMINCSCSTTRARWAAHGSSPRRTSTPIRH